MSRFEWIEFLYVAWELRGRPRSRLAGRIALYRTSIGRAYYTVFNLARDFLREHDGIETPRVAVHEFVIQQFGSSQDPIRIAISRELQFLRGLRTQADYNHTLPNIDGIVDKVLQRAERVVRLLGQL